MDPLHPPLVPQGTISRLLEKETARMAESMAPSPSVDETQTTRHVRSAQTERATLKIKRTTIMIERATLEIEQTTLEIELTTLKIELTTLGIGRATLEWNKRLSNKARVDDLDQFRVSVSEHPSLHRLQRDPRAAPPPRHTPHTTRRHGSNTHTYTHTDGGGWGGVHIIR